MYELTIKSDIMSAHYLREYEGKCKNLHGHTWKIEAFIRGEQLNELGMICDFTLLKSKFNEFLSTMDHGCLNELEYFKDRNPTTEHIAKYVYESFAEIIKPLELAKVQVWESDNSSVIYYK